MSSKASNRPIWVSISASFAYLIAALGVNYIAGTYASSFVRNSSVPDLFHTILPVVDTNFIYNQGAILFWIIIALLLIRNPKKAPFVIMSIATLILVRSFFLTLTHPGQIANDQTRNGIILSFFSFKTDYFFSAHTANPFLMALIFWESNPKRILFLFLSILFGVSVILGRMHYSVDVFAAFFITYGVYAFCRSFFKNYFQMFNSY